MPFSGEYYCKVFNTKGTDLTRAVVNVDGMFSIKIFIIFSCLKIKYLYFIAYTYVPDSEFSEVHSEDESNIILEEDESEQIEKGGPTLLERLEPITSVRDGEKIV